MKTKFSLVIYYLNLLVASYLFCIHCRKVTNSLFISLRGPFKSNVTLRSVFYYVLNFHLFSSCHSTCADINKKNKRRNFREPAFKYTLKRDLLKDFIEFSTSAPISHNQSDLKSIHPPKCTVVDVSSKEPSEG